MKDKFAKLVNRGINIFGILMKCKLVTIIIFLFTGTLHIIDPRGGLRGTVTMLTIFIALYALLSIIFILTKKNQAVGEGKKFAVDMVKETLKGDGNPISKINEILSQNEKYEQKVANSETKARWDKRIKMLTERHDKTPKAGVVVMCIFYVLLLFAAVFMFFWPDATIYAVHIILGALLVFDGLSGIWTVISARINKVPMKGKLLSVLFNLLSIAVGLFFIIYSGDTADFTMVLCGIVLVLKAISDLVIMIHNKELISTIKSTLDEIKNPEPEQSENDTEEEQQETGQKDQGAEQDEKDTEQKDQDTETNEKDTEQNNIKAE